MSITLYLHVYSIIENTLYVFSEKKLSLYFSYIGTLGLGMAMREIYKGWILTPLIKNNMHLNNKLHFKSANENFLDDFVNNSNFKDIRC